MGPGEIQQTFQASSLTSQILPQPRSKPLVAGSRKEDALRQHLEEKTLHISRRYTKKFLPAEEQRSDDITGYVNMNEVTRDLEGLIETIWVSGTPYLQTQHFLNIAGMINDYLPAFPPAPKATFSLLQKMDYAFSSLLKGKDIVTGDDLPGFFNARRAGFSKTDMVRLQSLVEKTRVLVVTLMSDDMQGNSDADTQILQNDMESYDMSLAEVYQRTIVQLGEIIEPDGFLRNQTSSFLI